MKYFLPLIIFLLSVTFTKAQFVDIPDSNFRKFLMEKYPACFNQAAQMDTTCDSVLLSTKIDCSNRNIESIEGIQFFKNVYEINCSHNRLTSLPGIPEKFLFFDCSSNELTNFPDLPLNLTPLRMVRTIRCQYNKLKCLPLLKNLSGIYMDSTIECVNYADGNYSTADFPMAIHLYGKNGVKDTVYYLPRYTIYAEAIPYPTCNPVNNKNGCPLPSIVKGKIYYDNNKNGVKDMNEPNAVGVSVNISAKYEKALTDDYGRYNLSTVLTGNYTITPTPPSFFVSNPVNMEFHFPDKDTVVEQDFALQPVVEKDSLVNFIFPYLRPRPGFSFVISAYSKNAGTTKQYPDIKISYDPTILHFEGSYKNSLVDHGNYVEVLSDTIEAGEIKSFSINFKVNNTARSGDSVINIATFSNGASVQYDTSKMVVTSSYDPNDKQATPSLTTTQVTNGDYIDYTIRFQNTGNDTAFNVVIADTLSYFLQYSTLELVGASHNCRTQLIGNTVFFEFLNINLPDSNINLPQSHGFIRFRVRPVKSVAVDNVINNKAFIYFDYNAPVVTNIASTLIVPSQITPVRLVNLSADLLFNNQVELNWATETELNVKCYEVEQSNDGVHFVSIGKVVAQGLRNYEYSVEMPVSSVVYYRLKITDLDGSLQYSYVLKVQPTFNVAGVIAFSNSNGTLQFNVIDKKLVGSKAALLGSNGQLIKTIKLQSGINNSVSGLSPGVYYFKTVRGSLKVSVL